MAKIRGALFSMDASGSFGEIIFDRRGYAYFKPKREDAQSPGQGNYRLAIALVQKCVKVCGQATRQQLRAMADDPGHWSSYLARHMIGPQRITLLNTLARYTDPAVDQAAWETAAESLGMREVFIPYAQHGPITPGAQLFVLASTLFSLGLYAGLGQPNGNAEVWKDSITS